MSKQIKEIANQIITRLKEEEFTIQRYDAYSTNSVYLKLDYGVCNSVRISDHSGKKHLDYRYNMITSNTGYRLITTAKGWKRHFYATHQMESMIVQILEDREQKIDQYGLRYRILMQGNKVKHQDEKGFWRESVLV